MTTTVALVRNLPLRVFVRLERNVVFVLPDWLSFFSPLVVPVLFFFVALWVCFWRFLVYRV
jgi:hypothetical protein